jgi:hypothetical protein
MLKFVALILLCLFSFINASYSVQVTYSPTAVASTSTYFTDNQHGFADVPGVSLQIGPGDGTGTGAFSSSRTIGTNLAVNGFYGANLGYALHPSSISSNNQEIVMKSSDGTDFYIYSVNITADLQTTYYSITGIKDGQTVFSTSGSNNPDGETITFNVSINTSVDILILSPYAHWTGCTPVPCSISPISVGEFVIETQTNPTISSITNPTNKTYKANEDINFTMNWSSVVNVIGSPKIALNIGGTTKYATYVSGSGSTATVFRYTVESGLNDNDGIAVTSSSIDLNTGTIKDGSNNNATLTLGSISSLANVKVDALEPSVSSINISGTSPSNLTSLQFSVSFNESVTGVDVSDFSLTTSGTSGTISGISGSGTNYTVTVSSITGDGTIRLDQIQVLQEFKMHIQTQLDLDLQVDNLIQLIILLLL